MNILFFSSDSDLIDLVKFTLSRGFLDQDITWKLADSFDYLSSRPLDSFDLVISESRLAGQPAVNRFLKAKVERPIIFLGTAADLTIEYFDLFVIDFLTKPFNDQKFINTLKKIEQVIMDGNQTGSKKSYKKRFLTKTGTRLMLVPVENIAFFFSEDGMTFLMESGTSQKYMVEATLNQLEADLLDPMKFYRINRSVIINLDELIDMRPFQNGRLILSTRARSEEALIVAREKVHEFKAWIDQ
jgi:two-component system response regulator LytT